MEQKIVLGKAYVEKVDTGEEGVLEVAVASTPIEDRQGEVIEQEGWDLKNFLKNPVILWAHNIRDQLLPIGISLKTWIEGTGKSAKLMFRPKFDLQDPFAAEVYRKFKLGMLRSFSVGFMPIEQDGNRFLKQELLEISAVPVPANPEARVVLRESGVETMEMEDLPKKLLEIKEEAETESKSVVPFVATPMADEGRSWDSGAAIKRIKDWASDADGNIDFAKYKKAFAFVDPEHADTQGGYKLPHHDIENGELVVVWRGCAAAMGVMMGARGGADIPEAEMRGVYNHLAKHYAQFEKEPPEFKAVDNQVLKAFDKEIDSAYEERDRERLIATVESIRGEIRATKNIATESKEAKAGLNRTLAVLNSAVDKLLVQQGNGGDK